MMKKLKIEKNFLNPREFNLKSAFKALFDNDHADPAFIWDSVNRESTMRNYYYGITKNHKFAQKIILKVMVCGSYEKT